MTESIFSLMPRTPDIRQGGGKSIRSPRRISPRSTPGNILAPSMGTSQTVAPPPVPTIQPQASSVQSILNPDILNPSVRGQIEQEDPFAIGYSVFGNLINRGNPLAEFIQRNLGDYRNRYIASVYEDPSRIFDQNYTLENFLRGINPQAEFGRLAPQQRGERPWLFNPRIKFI